MVSTLESQIDDLYRKPLSEFVAARAALASELKGAEAQRVKALKKPTVVPWAVNQVYWHARSIFDRVQRSGAELRRAQIAALEGRSADVHAASAAHREAIAAAVERAVALAGTAQVNPSRDAVARTFEALSLAADPPEGPGRLTQPLQPGGFELLAGVQPLSRPTRGTRDVGDGLQTVPHSPATPPKTHRGSRARVGDSLKTVHQAVPTSKPSKAEARRAAKERAAAAERAAAERKRERAMAAAARRHDAEIARLERDVERARQQAARARQAWDRATDEVSAAELRLGKARGPRRVV